MNRILKYYTKNLLPAIIILVLTGVLIEFLLTQYSLRQNEDINTHLINLEFSKFSKQLQQPISDIYYLTSRFSSHDNDFFEFLKSDFFVFSQSRDYYQIRILDTAGHETLRVNYDKGQHQITPDSLLQDKSHRYYFPEAQKLKKNQIYFSKLDLNQEYGEIVHPFELVIRIISPIFNNTSKVGYVAINLKMNEFVKELTLGEHSNQKLMVYNQDSINLSYLICPECKYYETIANTLEKNTQDKISFKALDFSKIINEFNSIHQANLALINKGWISIAADNQINSKSLITYRVIIYGILFTLVIIFYAFLLTVRVQNMDHKLNRTMKEVLHSEKLLTIKNSQLESFVRIASHDLREPLATIKSTTRSLLDYENKLTDKQFPKYIEFIIRCVDRMDGLTKGILDYAITGESSTLSLINVSNMIYEIRNDLHHTIKEKNALITHKTLPTIVAYPLELKQIFQNLISNAIKYNRENVSPVVVIMHEESSRYHTFKVIDNGIGISEHDRFNIFQMFMRLEKKPEEDGLGIGLSITQKLVELHGGSIALEQNDNEGSTFVFTISKELDIRNI